MDDFRQPYIPNIKPIPDHAFEALSKEVTKFQKKLPDHREIGISVSGIENVIHVSSIRQRGQMVIFEGTDNLGRDACLIQHYTQINVQIIAVDALAERANRIGF